MQHLKASGRNGMSPIFFQKYWHIADSLVTRPVLSCLNHGCISTEQNETFVVLVPKKKKPKKITKFRPISLYNVVYKIIAKVIANRLKLILLQVVSPNQCACAFVSSHLITDTVLVAFETVHAIYEKRNGCWVVMSFSTVHLTRIFLSPVRNPENRNPSAKPGYTQSGYQVLNPEAGFFLSSSYV